MFQVLESLLSVFNRRSYRKRRLIFINNSGRRSRRPLVIFLFLLILGLVVLIVNRESLISDILDDWWSNSPVWEEDSKPHVNPHAFKFLLDSRNVCAKNENVDLLVLVASAFHHFDRRDAIRRSWASEEWRGSRAVKVVFLLGESADKQQSKLTRENEENGDIVQEDFKDTYYNLTLKTVMGLKWASIYCPQAKFLLKTDDDMFVSLPTLHSALHKDSHFDGHIVGCIKNNPESAPKPIPSSSSSKLASLPQAHPAFVAGAGYILPGGAYIRDLYYASLRTRFFAIEDVFTTAHVASRIGLHPPVHDFRFSCGEMSPINTGQLDVAQYCTRLKIIFTEHKVKPRDMMILFRILSSEECQSVVAN